MKDIKVLTFDVGGSVFDWQASTHNVVGKLAQQRQANLDVEEFCFTWRRRMFECLGEVRRGDRDWQNADDLHLSVLHELAKTHRSLELTDEDCLELNKSWHRMNVWDDVPAALLKLRQEYVVAILTVLSLSIVVDSSKYAGIDWDAYLSCEFLGVYKPDAAAYQTAATLLGATPAQTMMVAVHPPDLLAAQAAGLQTAYVKPKKWEMGAVGDTSTFDVIAEDYHDLARQICDN